ncbi:MAG: glycosyltransferase family 2 protein [Actinobacteria bacterium]|nr:glycosyltransferase family 2 protein [Actinomycetota bacterium]
MARATVAEKRLRKALDADEHELKALLREEFAGLAAEQRAELLQRVAKSAVKGNGGSAALSARLHGVREVLRERLPICVVDERQPIGLAVEQILAIDERSFWISGWAREEEAGGRIVVVSPEGHRVDLSKRAFRFERPDVVQFYAGLGRAGDRDQGFTAFFELPASSRLGSGWVVELHTAAGAAVEVQCPPVNTDPQAVRTTILGELGNHAPPRRLAAEHGRHALSRLQERIVGEAEIDSVDTYGEPPELPEVSVIIPLYRRLDFLEHQLLHFSIDPELAEAELVYVLDSVEQREELAARARELFALYRLPFRVVNPTAGSGFAGANRHGVAVASGRKLLLLNSDVIPDRPGWLGEMCRFYDAGERIGALGAKLLYEDDSLQHAGLYFHRLPGTEVWENAHRFKGLHRSFPAAAVAQPVPAVTAACALVDRERYEEVGGLPLHYVQGDYEDSELCLRLAEAGYENWYLPEAELYHLEGQSYVAEARRGLSDYNMWLHSELWGEEIAATMERFDPHAATVAGQGVRR